MNSGVPYSHVPASLFGGSTNGSDDTETQGKGPFQCDQPSDMDSRVKWSHATAATLKSQSSNRLNSIKRNRRLYDGDQWSADRPAWKNNAVINYCAFVCDHWTALLSDNKPRFVYEPLRRGDEVQAEMVSALRDFDELRDGWQEKRELAILTARVEQNAYYTLRYDPFAYAYEGGIKLTVVSPTQIYLDRNATSIEDAETVLYEYYESEGELLLKYKKLRKVAHFSKGADSFGDDTGDMVGVPAQYVESTSGPIYEPQRSAPAAERYGGDGGRGHRVREWWLRQKGPQYMVTIKRSKWKPGDKLATKKKFLKFEDGHLEPLQTVIMENGTVYELPISIALTLQTVGEFFSGVKVKYMNDALEAVLEEVEVPKYPAGRRLVIVGDYVADDGANPFAHEEFPFVELRALYGFNTKGNVCGDIDRFYRLQEFLNRIYALVMDCAQLTSNPITVVPTDSQISDEDFTNAPGSIMRGDAMTIKLMRRLEGPSLPSYVMNLMTFTIQEILKISGLNEIATGGKFKGQQAAETVTMYQESASVIFRQGIRHVEQAEVKLGKQYLGLVKQFYTDTRMLKIKNSLGIAREVKFKGTDLSTDFLMKAKSGSQLPSSPSARLAAMTSMLGQGLTDIPEVLKYMQENGIIESADETLRRLEYYASHPDQLWKAPGLAALLGQLAKGKSSGKSKGNSNNAGRSIRNTSPTKAMQQK